MMILHDTAARTCRDLRLITGLCLPLFALAACQQPEASDTRPAPQPLEEPAPEIAALTLLPLEQVHLAEMDLAGELGCSFTVGETQVPRLVASGYVDTADSAAQALVRPGEMPVMLQAQGRGGYDAIIDGGTFIGDGLSVNIVRTSNKQLGGSGESPAYPATLHAWASDGRVFDVEGQWTCGP